jgi:hypothetical protein
LDEFVLACIPDHELERALIRSVEMRLAARRADQDEFDVVNALRGGMRALYLTWTVESEVIEGGFARYFWNWTGRFAAEAAEAFEFFGAREHARLLREAIRVYDEDCDKTYVSDGRKQIDAYESWRLEVLEDHFYELDESLCALRIAKIRGDLRAFCDDGV